MKVVIVGGVAGGASAAARLRRLREDAEIILLERGEYVSYANCGLPYYIGGAITQKSALSVQTPESLRQRMALDVRVGHKVVAINPAQKTVEVQEVASGKAYTESYDKLVLSPGAEPVRPAFAQIQDERIFTLRTIPDVYRMDAFIKEKAPKHALVVGGGFIGLEMAENLVHAGLKVTVAEMGTRVLPPLDDDMAADVQQYLRQQGVQLLLENSVQAIESEGQGLKVVMKDGSVNVDMVLLSVGVRPESELAAAAGLSVSERGAIIVDKQMRTSDENIYAVGDAVQNIHTVSGVAGYIPLAGPANKQGRIAADNIAGMKSVYNGSQGTAILKLFDMAVGASGLNEQAAKQAGFDFDKVYLFAGSHAGYYPGAQNMSIKVLFEKSSGRLLGAQIVGGDGVDKRLDVLAAAIREGATAERLTELEHGYAPPFSSAKDPVNMIGFMIENLQNNMVTQYHWHDVEQLLQEGVTLLDVRTPAEYAPGHIKGAVNIQLDELRERIGELDKTKPLYIYCKSGQRSYIAARILQGNGFDVKHLAGGYRLYASVALNYPSLMSCTVCN